MRGRSAAWGLLAGGMLAGGWAMPVPAGDLPAACESACTTAFGVPLGTAGGSVPAYSNCAPGCFVPRPNAHDGVYTGIRWQCVEYARRWLVVKHGLTFGDVDIAADLWDRVEGLTRLADGTRVALEAFPNGATSPPREGDLLIYARSYEGTGHVAVVTSVDPARGTIRVAEQNFRNQPWPGDYAREVDLIERAGRFWVLDPHLIGWKRPVAADPIAPLPAGGEGAVTAP